MKKIQIQLAIVVGLILIIFSFFCFERIDAGHVGIRAYNYGSQRGVSDVTEVMGFVWYNPFTQKIYEVPTYVQTANYKDDDNGNKHIKITTKDGLSVSIDASMNYSTPEQNVVKIFKKYRKPLNELESSVLRNLVVGTINSVATNYNCEDIYEKRSQFENEVYKSLSTQLAKDGFVVENFVIIGNLGLPDNIVKNINAKVSATQIALTKQQEVVQEKFDADKKIQRARGDSAEIVINSKAKAEAYKLELKELNYLYIQKSMADKWDGKLPQYGVSPTLFKDIGAK